MNKIMDEIKLSALAVNIVSINPMFYKRLGKPVPMNSDITPGAYYAMMCLKKYEALSMTNLGEKLLVPKPNATALVNKLIAKGLAIRSSDKHDRRVIMIRLSSKGVQFVEKNSKKYHNQIIKRLMSLTENELELLATSLQNIKDIMSKIPVMTPEELNIKSNY